MGRYDEVPESSISIECIEYIEVFNAIKGICRDVEEPITPAIIAEWGRHIYRDFERWERHAIMEMDGAFRRAWKDVVKFHQDRPQIKADGDLERMSRGR